MKSLTKYLLSTFGGKVVRRVSVENVCQRFGSDATYTINFMISYGYFIRILRGLYYVKTLEEFMLKKAPDIYRVLSLGMDELKVRWYFGLYTALRFNGVTHEFSDTVFILNDEIFRPKIVKVSGERVRFIKISPNLFGFGVIERGNIKFSDLEKSILDLVYLSRYRSTPEEKIVATIEEYAKGVRTEKVKEYLKAYPKTVSKVVENAGVV
jgi:predicted transcriptional regulator of viral defense system